MNEKKYHISIVWPEHAGVGMCPIENYDNCTLLRDEAHFGFLVFQDNEGREHWVSHAFAVLVNENPTSCNQPASEKFMTERTKPGIRMGNLERRAKIVETLATHTTSYRNRYLKDSDPASWRWQCSCGASLSNLPSWEACEAVTKKHWAELIDEALITQTSAALQIHWLLSIECDHENKTDVANCACGFWKSQPMPTVGDAVKEWIKHALTAPTS